MHQISGCNFAERSVGGNIRIEMLHKTSFEPEGVFQTCMGDLPLCPRDQSLPYLAVLPLGASDQAPERLTIELAKLRRYSDPKNILMVLMNTLFPNNLVPQDDMCRNVNLTPRERVPAEQSVLAKFSSSFHRKYKFMSSIGDSQHDKAKNAIATTTTTTAPSYEWLTFCSHVGDWLNSVYPPHILGTMTGTAQKWYYPFLDLIVVDTEEGLRKAREDWVIAATDAILDRTKAHTALNMPLDTVLRIDDMINSHWGYFIHRNYFAISYLSISDDLEECTVCVYEDNWRDLLDPEDVMYLLREHQKIIHWALSTRLQRFDNSDQEIELVTTLQNDSEEE